MTHGGKPRLSGSLGSTLGRASPLRVGLGTQLPVEKPVPVNHSEASPHLSGFTNQEH